MTHLPLMCTDPLLTMPRQLVVPASFEPIGFETYCMNSTQQMLDQLLQSCDHQNQNGNNPRETLTPVLIALGRLSKHHRPIRKYCRSVILPPLRDLRTRPEVGNAARNKLCKLLTSTVEGVKEAAAEFLFVLCKESVARMVKYTGYGNAAGLLAQKGLMKGGKGANSKDYSDDDENSETEEYAQNAHQ